jgi:hypothetical protein
MDRNKYAILHRSLIISSRRAAFDFRRVSDRMAGSDTSPSSGFGVSR